MRLSSDSNANHDLFNSPNIALHRFKWVIGQRRDGTPVPGIALQIPLLPKQEMGFHSKSQCLDRFGVDALALQAALAQNGNGGCKLVTIVHSLWGWVSFANRVYSTVDNRSVLDFATEIALTHHILRRSSIIR